MIVLDNGEVIADDPPEALRRRIGGQILDVGVDAGDVDATTRGCAPPGSTHDPTGGAIA